MKLPANHCRGGRGERPIQSDAGLHHPILVCHYNPQSGFTMHGFLNILAAAALAPRAGFETLRRVVAEEEPSAFQFEAEGLRWRDERIGAEARPKLAGIARLSLTAAAASTSRSRT